MQVLVDILRQSLRTLWAHKLRSVLTMFGIAWGVGSLLLLVGLGEGFRSGNRRELASLGEDIMFLFGGRIPAVEGSLTAVRRYYLTYGDYLAVKAEARFVRKISPVLNREDIRASSDFANANGQVFGVVPVYNQIRTIPLKLGRWLNEQDDEERRRVAIVGNEMLKTMFPGRPAVGSTILLNGIRFDVVGVLAQIGKEGGNNGTNIRVFVPLSTMMELFPLKEKNSAGAVSYFNYQPRIRDEHDLAKQEMHRIIARRHGFDPKSKDAFEEWDTIENEKTVGKIFNAMDWFLGGVGLVTLSLGAIGIINIMLVSVAERTSEIGLRKALGATNRNILTQFFLEGTFLTVLSGAIGLGCAAGLMWGLSHITIPGPFDTPKIVPASAATAILALFIAGTVAGLYPAKKAADLTPVEALRQE